MGKDATRPPLGRVLRGPGGPGRGLVRCAGCSSMPFRGRGPLDPRAPGRAPSQRGGRPFGVVGGRGGPALTGGFASPRCGALRAPRFGGVAEWLKAADCKSADASLRRFESCPLHHLFARVRSPRSVDRPFRSILRWGSAEGAPRVRLRSWDVPWNRRSDRWCRRRRQTDARTRAAKTRERRWPLGDAGQIARFTAPQGPDLGWRPPAGSAGG